MSGFDFKKAQEHELEWQRNYIKDIFPAEHERWLQRKATLPSNHCLASFFTADPSEFNEYIKSRVALEIGCGSTPMLKECWDIKERIVIDPLAGDYDKIERELFGNSFFDGLKIYSQPAEKEITELIHKIDGVIIFRNALDHSEDPLAIISRISSYAAPDCYLLFWSDIWHNHPNDDGHRNITRDGYALLATFRGLGWDWVCRVPKVRDGDDYIELGGVFRRQ
jgi:hypothetical protein